MAAAWNDNLLEHIRRAAGHGACRLPDRELLKRFGETRDESAFAALVDRHGPMVWRVCRRLLANWHDAEDVFQATFLVLSRKAESVRRRESVAGWLYGVAYRLALKARVGVVRRRSREIRVSKTQVDDPLAELNVREAQGVLDEELARLPEKFRAPLVLCCLEGKARDEAARQLGWSMGILKSRLEQGREQLRRRLLRRGLTLPAALMAGLLAEGVAPAAVPILLARTTVQGAIAFSVGGTTAALSTQAVTLAEGGLKAVVATKIKLVAVLLLTAGLATGSGIAALHRLAAKAPQAKQEDRPKPAFKDAGQPKPQPERQARTDRYGDPLPAGAVARLGTTRLRQSEPVTALAFSPDGAVLASGGRDDGIVYLWDAASGKQLRRFLGHRRPPDAPNARTIFSIAFSLDGKTVASSGDGGVRLWELETGKEIRRIGEQAPTQSLALSPDGKLLAAGGWDNLVYLWEVASGKEIAKLSGHQGVVIAVAFAADGKTLASGGDHGAIRLWDVAGKREVGQLKGHEGRVLQLAFLPDGKTLLSSGRDNTLRVWDSAAGKELRRIEGAHVQFGSFALSPDGKLLAAPGGEYGRPSLWEIATGKKLRELPGHAFAMTAFTFSADGKRLAAGGHANTIHVWEVASGKALGPAGGHQAPVMGIAFCAGGKIVVTGGQYEPGLRTWDAATGKELRQLPCGGWGSILAVSPDGKTLATCGGMIALWDVASGKKVRECKGHQLGTYHLAFSPDGKLLASSSWNNDPVRLWDVATAKELRQLAHPGNVSSLAFSPDGKLLAVGDSTGSVHLWDPRTGKTVRQLLQAKEEVLSLAFAPDGKTLAVGSLVSAPRGQPMQSKLRLWELATGQVRHLFEGKSIGVHSVALGPNGRTLVSAGGTGLWLWDVPTGKELRRFEGHDGGVTGAVLSPDGDRVASAGWDTTALIWDVADLVHRRRREVAKLSADEPNALWTDLAGSDAAKGYRAIWRLTAASKQTVPFFKQHIHPVQPADPQRLASLLGDLDSEQFAVRDKASQELEKLGDLAESALRKALDKLPPPEARRRLEKLLADLEGSIPVGERLRDSRAIEVLEHIGTPDALQVLEFLAKGAPEARLTQEAKASLDRLHKLAAKKP